MKDNSRTH